MEWLFIILGFFVAVFLIVTFIEFILGFKQIKNLKEQNILPDLPAISVIVCVLNEEKNIESVAHSLVNLNYPNLDIIIVNDRSTDKTPEILNQLKMSYPQLNIIHIEQLPAGWFGKNHASFVASKQAKGEWILFSDADVTMKQDALLKAMSYAKQHELDHLTIHEYHPHQSFWLKISLLGYYFCYSLDIKPWRIRHAWSKKFLGRGAFNLVKKSSYEQCGGHQAIALQCLDDLQLGALFKKNGFQQDVANAQDYVQFEWYSSAKAMISGLEKNSFAYRNYRLWPALRDLFFAVIVFVWPFIAMFAFSGPVRWINLLIAGLLIVMTAYVAHQYRLHKRFAIFFPIAIVVMLYTVCNSIVMTYKNKGVIWRGTHYPLEKLR